MDSHLTRGHAIHKLIEEQMQANATIADGMAHKQAQRFGRVEENFGEFGELRKQKKSPHKLVMYVYVYEVPKFPIGGISTPNARNRVLRSLQNCTSEQITDAIKFIGEGLTQARLVQVSAEKLLDWCYAELHRRLSGEASE